MRRNGHCRITIPLLSHYLSRIFVDDQGVLGLESLICDEFGRRIAPADAQIVAKCVLLAFEPMANPRHHALDDALPTAGLAVYRVAFQHHSSAVYLGMFAGCSHDPSSRRGGALCDVEALDEHRICLAGKISIYAEVDRSPLRQRNVLKSGLLTLEICKLGLAVATLHFHSSAPCNMAASRSS